jgi:aminoglycoside phosphotransferase (APT) family kinase protein
MSTIGHPLSDLINLTTPYYLKDATQVRHLPSFKEGATPGLPTQEDLVKWYAEVAGWDPSPDLTWGIAFGFFRATCIYQGIAARYAVRQASSAKAKDNASQRHPMGELAWHHVARAKKISKDKAKL